MNTTNQIPSIFVDENETFFIEGKLFIFEQFGFLPGECVFYPKKNLLNLI